MISHIAQTLHATAAAPMRVKTFCGRTVPAERCIPQSACVDEATCKACQRVDDARQVRNYAAECKAAGKAYGEL